MVENTILNKLQSAGQNRCIVKGLDYSNLTLCNFFDLGNDKDSTPELPFDILGSTPSFSY